MTLSNIKLLQKLSANVSSTGSLRSSILVGGSNTTALTTSEADIIYGFTIISGDTNNDVKWHLADSTLEDGAHGDALTDLVSTQEIGTSATAILDVNGVAVPTATTIVALYYETDKANDGDVTITTAGTSGAKLGGTFTLDGDNGTSARSALFIPRFAAAGTYVNFTWTATTDIIRVVCLAKDA